MELLAAYTLDQEKLLGHGSFSNVHLGTCNRTGGAVAVKIISSNVVKHGRLTVKVDVLKKCQHPNIIALRDELVTRKNETALVFQPTTWIYAGCSGCGEKLQTSSRVAPVKQF